MNKYVQQVKEIVLDCMRNEPVHVYLFGSWARGTARQGSDVDVAVEYLIDM
jgi:predicted nucleotidyltransferase